MTIQVLKYRCVPYACRCLAVFPGAGARQQADVLFDKNIIKINQLHVVIDFYTEISKREQALSKRLII